MNAPQGEVSQPETRVAPGEAPARTGGHAIVIGGSMAGLITARVLSDYFAHVTVLERDRMPDTPEFRRGVPQARHAHTLLIPGQKILERLFPGLVEELIAEGAVSLDTSRDIASYYHGSWDWPQAPRLQVCIACSRPLLEAAVCRRVAARGNVEMRPGQEAAGLHVHLAGQRATGVRVRRRHAAAGGETSLAGDLVVDASGRHSQAPRWLHDLGLTPPEEWTVNSFTGYTTRLYRRPPRFDDGWKMLSILPTPPDSPRGGVILPAEGDVWYVTLIGTATDYPPTDEAGFLDYARSLPTPRLYEAIRHAEALAAPVGFRQTENRVRRYDQLPRYLDGLLVVGDAVYTLNPLFALGMTAAAMGSVALDGCLHEWRHRLPAGDVGGLAAAFQKKLSESLAGLWSAVTQKEWQWPLTEVDDTMFGSPGPAGRR